MENDKPLDAIGFMERALLCLGIVIVTVATTIAVLSLDLPK